jgi:CBS domain-containing protein
VTARKLISSQVVVGRANDRLPDVAGQLARLGTHHLVVVHETTGKFIGIIRLADVAWRANASTRILGDLVSAVRPVLVQPNESAAAVSETFLQHRLGEAVVLAEDGCFLGLITAESVLAWNCDELKRTQNLLRLEEDTSQVVRTNLQTLLAEKERYLASLSHSLRSPLNPMMLVASARAESAELPEDVRHDFRTIANNAALEARLIDELIDGARSSRTRPPLASQAPTEG